MYGPRNYDNVTNSVNSDLQNSRNAIKLHDANKNIDELKKEITKLEMMIRAMVSIMNEQDRQGLLKFRFDPLPQVRQDGP